MSTIEWLARPGTKPESWNPVTGCRKVSEGCRNCYAEAMADRFWAKQYAVVEEETGGPAGTCSRSRRFTDVMCHEDRLSLPLSWRGPRTVFVNSMSDLFHSAVPDEFIDQVFAVMALSRKHTFIVLTKRPERMRAYFFDDSVNDRVADATAHMYDRHGGEFCGWATGPMFEWAPLPNVWLGVSIEDQPTADQRIPLLLQTPAAVRAVSYEPALGPVNFREVACREDWHIDAFDTPDPSCRIHWAIVGGESGPQARPCDVAWIRSTVQQCKTAGVPVFVKQLGANPATHCGQCGRGIGHHILGGFVDACGPTHAAVIAEMSAIKAGKGNDPAEWPKDLNCREWPEVRS
jgi:protein gp37